MSDAPRSEPVSDSRPARHTPGPWVAGKTTWNIHTSDHGDIAFMPAWAQNSAEGQANARLIAAAPDLLAALKASVKFIDKGIAAAIAALPNDEEREGKCDGLISVAEQVNAAIAKAEGRSR